MKNSKALLFAGLFLVLSASALSEYERLAKGFVELDHPYSAKHYYRETEFGSESIVEFREGGIHNDPEVIRDLRRKTLEINKDRAGYKKRLDEQLLNCTRSDYPGFFKFLPTFEAVVTVSQPFATFDSHCFSNESVQLTVVNESYVTLTHTRGQGRFDCGDAYLYTTIGNHHSEVYYFKGTTKIDFVLTPTDWNNIQTNGLMVFRFCDAAATDIPDFFKTLLLFIGGLGVDPNIPFFGSKPTKEQIEENVKFIYEATGYQWEKRPKNELVQLNQSLIQSGDFFAITRFDGLDQIIEWGAGSHAGHSVVAMWVGDELYMFESQAAWYWPRKGIQMNPFSQWVEWAWDADFHVTWLPLTAEAAAQFNATAAYEWFLTIEGTPYGYHNFLWGWIDTVNASYPALLDPEFVAPLFGIVEQLSPFAAAEVYGDAMNMRLGTQNLTVPEIAYAAYEAGLTMPDMYAIVEEDGWVYNDGLSYVCSAFVTAIWKAGGLYDGFEINAVEFTPRDIYQTTFIELNPVVPENCKAVDPVNPYCQIMGEYRMQFPGISTVEPYSHMNEHCPSQAPDFARTPGC